MILHPGVLSLLMSSAIIIFMMIYSVLLGLKILRRWNISSSSSVQLALERKTYLISTIMNYVLGFEILSLLLFIYTADDIHGLFAGAMCATGALNANPVGWYVLYTKIFLFFTSSVWIALNYIDQRAEDYPFVKAKYTYLIFLSPFVILDAYLQYAYFLGLKPNVITSCCGALFSESGRGLAGSLSALPIKTTMYAFFTVIGLVLISGILSLLENPHWPKYLFSFLSVSSFVISVTAVISFISLYFYEIPTHHCPFDILQGNYGYIGYPMYITLFGGTFFGTMVGLTEPLKRVRSVHGIIDKLQKKWTAASLTLIVIFTVISLRPIIFSSFTLKGYY